MQTRVEFILKNNEHVYLHLYWVMLVC